MDDRKYLRFILPPWGSILFCIVIGFMLISCEKSSDDGRPSRPIITLTMQAIKTFHFTWDDVGDETEYRLLEDQDGHSGFSLVKTIAVDSTSEDILVFLPSQVNARYLLQACNNSGCSDSNTLIVSGTLAEAIGYVKASNTGGDDNFGASVALSADGNTLVVGAYGEDSQAIGINGDQDDNSMDGSGAVYVFTPVGTLWSQQAYIKASNTGPSDLFGISVALSADGNTLAVGAINEASIATGINGDQLDDSGEPAVGAAYVFTRKGEIWSQQAYVKTSNSGILDDFGSSVALSADGNMLAIGAPREDSNATGIGGNQSDNNDAQDSGAVYVFARIGATWNQQVYLKASNTESFDSFGKVIALSADGNTLAVGAAGEDSAATGIGGDQGNNAAANAGAVYIFARNDTGWSQQAYVKASNTREFEIFGNAVALSGDGNTLAVGASYESSNASGVDGDQTNNSAPESGSVYVFTRSGSVWIQQAYVKASNTEPFDSFGSAVSLSADGDTLAVGAISEDSTAHGIDGDQSDNSGTELGAVYVFRRNDTLWSQQAYVKASDTSGERNVFYGLTVALSSSGETLAVGAHGENSGATGIGGDQADTTAFNSGAVYLY